MCDAHDTLLSDTLQSNGLTGTDRRPGVWLRNKPTDLSVCVEECEDEEGVVVKLNIENRVSTGDVRAVSEKVVRSEGERGMHVIVHCLCRMWYVLRRWTTISLLFFMNRYPLFYHPLPGLFICSRLKKRRKPREADISFFLLKRKCREQYCR